MTEKVKHTISPSAAISVIVGFTPRVDEDFATLLIERNGSAIMCRLEKEDIGHLINALRRAKKYSK